MGPIPNEVRIPGTGGETFAFRLLSASGGVILEREHSLADGTKVLHRVAFRKPEDLRSYLKTDRALEGRPNDLEWILGRAKVLWQTVQQGK